MIAKDKIGCPVNRVQIKAESLFTATGIIPVRDLLTEKNGLRHQRPQVFNQVLLDPKIVIRHKVKFAFLGMHLFPGHMCIPYHLSGLPDQVFYTGIVNHLCHSSPAIYPSGAV